MHLCIFAWLSIWLHIPASAAEGLLYTSHCPCPAWSVRQLFLPLFEMGAVTGGCRWLGSSKSLPSRTCVLPRWTTRHLSCHQQRTHTSLALLFV